MKNLKKVTAVAVVLLLVLGTMSIGAFASVDSGAVGITINADKTTNLYPGDIVTFTVNISTNFHYTGMRWPVMYTLKAFEPVVANDGNGDADYGNVDAIDGGGLDAPDSYLESTEASTNDPFGSPYTKANYGCILIQWTGATSGTSVTNYYAPSGADCLTFQLRVKSGYTANKGVATVAIPTTTQAKNVFYYEGVEFPNNANSTFFLTPTTMTVTSTPCTVSIIKEAPGILPKDGSPTVLDTEGETNYIYGFNTIFSEMEMIDDSTIFKYITLTGNATIELIENDMGMISTGAKLRVYDASQHFLEEYTVVVFGDINGDCVIDVTDSGLLIDGYLYMEEWTYGDTVRDNATFFSCDINGDEVVDSTDYGPFNEAFEAFGYINQSNDPENFFIYT